MIKKKTGLIIKAEHLGRYLFARDLLRRAKITKAYDIGAGSGYGTRILSSPTLRVYGFDKVKVGKNSYGIDLEKKHLSHEVGLLGIPLPQALVCFETLEHIERSEKIISDFSRLLRTGNYLLLSVPYGRFEPKRKGRSKDRFHKHIFYPYDMSYLLEKNGFRIIEWRWQPFTLFLFHRTRWLIPLLERIFLYNTRLLIVFSRLFAYPIHFTPFSYSMIVVAVKT